jgi:hypothetical protein
MGQGETGVCGDMFFSGHTAACTLAALFAHRYTPSAWRACNAFDGPHECRTVFMTPFKWHLPPPRPTDARVSDARDVAIAVCRHRTINVFDQPQSATVHKHVSYESVFARPRPQACGLIDAEYSF